MSRERRSRGVLFVRNLTPGVKDHFKATCARRGESMTDVIEALMRKYVYSPKCVKVRKNRTSFRLYDGEKQ